ncbi:hypothetical protein [Pseudoalteromonas sp. S16_S37]|nr:hypothetical protein [Pseudoalteromonas sp. S16_S37]MBD1583370.1 hypothetical protein [Pseudoalteromonas sp. S16_S37]
MQKFNDKARSAYIPFAQGEVSQSNNRYETHSVGWRFAYPTYDQNLRH